MYLTRMELDPGKRDTRRALVSPNLLHGAIESSFPGERERRLWRVDEFGGRYYLLLLSHQLPELSSAARQFGRDGEEQPWQTKCYDSLLERIREGSVWQFRLTANPTVSVKSSIRGERGKVNAHITPDHQMQWLLDRSLSHGFSIVPQATLVIGSQWQRFYKGSQRSRPVSLLSVTYQGLLTVTDADLFRRTLERGIGRGRAYGMGLLTVMSPRGGQNG